MLHLPFINRIEDLKFLDSYTESIGIDNKVVFICSESGLGKSKLTQKFTEHCKNLNILAIKIEINQRGNEQYDAGYYLRKIGKKINALSKGTNIKSLNEFCRTLHSKPLTKRLTEAIRSDFIDILPYGKKTAGEISSRFLGKGDYDEDLIFESAHFEILALIHDYIKEQFKHFNIVLNIENIQSIDDYSLKAIQSIISEATGSFFLLEYTEKDPNGFSLNYLIGQLESSSSKFNTYQLKPINILEIIEAMKQYPELSMEIFKNSYTTWDGNLRPLIDVIIKLKYEIKQSGNIHDADVNISFQNATFKHIETLKTNELFLLVLIYSHQEPVTRYFLNFLNSYQDAFKHILDIDITLDELTKRMLVKRNGNEFEIYHDSIATILLEFDKAKRYFLISYKYWFSFYENTNTTNELYISKSLRLFRTLYFASILGYDNKIYSLIDEIGKQALKTSAPKQMIVYLIKIKNKLERSLQPLDKTSKLYEINKHIIELFYNVGLYKEAFELANSIESLDKNIIVLKAVLFIEKGEHLNAYNLTLDEVSTVNHSGFEIILVVIRILALYGLDKMDECKKLFEVYYNNPLYKDVFEYGFLLRTSELIYSLEETILHLKESIYHFDKFHATIQSAYSKNNYAVHLAISGKLKEANTYFKAIDKDLTDVSIERHTILNNLACILLSQKKITDEIEVLLRQALVTAELDSEKIAIYSNYLILFDWRQNDEFALKIIADIEAIIERSMYIDEGILSHAYYNIYMFYSTRSNSLFTSYWQACFDINFPLDSLWKYRLLKEEFLEIDDNYFLVSIDRAISFLCHWNIEYDSKTMHY